MVDRQVDGEEIVEYKGTKIELCCSACVKKFKNDPDYYVKLTKGLLPQIPEKLVPEDLKLMDQKFCLVYDDRVVTPKSYKYKYEGKEYFFWSNSAIQRFSQKPDFYLSRYKQQKREVAKKLNIVTKERATSANSDN